MHMRVLKQYTRHVQPLNPPCTRPLPISSKRSQHTCHMAKEEGQVFGLSISILGGNVFIAEAALNEEPIQSIRKGLPKAVGPTSRFDSELPVNLR